MNYTKNVIIIFNDVINAMTDYKMSIKHSVFNFRILKMELEFLLHFFQLWSIWISKTKLQLEKNVNDFELKFLLLTN